MSRTGRGNGMRVASVGCGILREGVFSRDNASFIDADECDFLAHGWILVSDSAWIIMCR